MQGTVARGLDYQESIERALTRVVAEGQGLCTQYGSVRRQHPRRTRVSSVLSVEKMLPGGHQRVVLPQIAGLGQQQNVWAEHLLALVHNLPWHAGRNRAGAASHGARRCALQICCHRAGRLCTQTAVRRECRTLMKLVLSAADFRYWIDHVWVLGAVA